MFDLYKSLDKPIARWGNNKGHPLGRYLPRLERNTTNTSLQYMAPIDSRSESIRLDNSIVY